MSKVPLESREHDWLETQIRLWQSRDIISGDQALRILGLYETPEEIVRRSASRGIFILKAVAATCVGLAVLLLVGYNWESLSSVSKVAILFSAVAGAHGAGFVLRYRRGARRASEVAFFLGCLLYGASIFLVAQIFHLNAHTPGLVWWWALGVLPFALCMDTLLLHALLVGLLATWTGMEILQFRDLGGWLFGRQTGIPNGAYTLLPMALAGLLWAYRKGSSHAVALYAPLLAWWLVLQPVAWKDDSNPVYFIGAVGAMFLVLAECHRERSDFAVAYRGWGAMIAFGSLVPLSFYDFNRLALDSGAPATFAKTGLILILAVAAGVVSRLRGVREARLAHSLPQATMEFWRRQWLPMGLIGLMLVMSLLAMGKVAADARVVMSTVLANVAFVGGSLWLMGLGLREDRGRPFGAGVFLFLVWAVMRYFDLFGDFGGMPGAAAMFLMCGGVLYGVARYWKKRKELRHA